MHGVGNCQLDTLLLTMPVGWPGTLAQYAGRLHASKRDFVPRKMQNLSWSVQGRWCPHLPPVRDARLLKPGLFCVPACRAHRSGNRPRRVRSAKNLAPSLNSISTPSSTGRYKMA